MKITIANAAGTGGPDDSRPGQRGHEPGVVGHERRPRPCRRARANTPSRWRWARRSWRRRRACSAASRRSQLARLRSKVLRQSWRAVILCAVASAVDGRCLLTRPGTNRRCFCTGPGGDTALAGRRCHRQRRRSRACRVPRPGAWTTAPSSRRTEGRALGASSRAPISRVDTAAHAGHGQRDDRPPTTAPTPGGRHRAGRAVREVPPVRLDQDRERRGGHRPGRAAQPPRPRPAADEGP